VEAESIGEMTAKATIEEFDNRLAVAKFAGQQELLASAVEERSSIGIGQAEIGLGGPEEPPRWIFRNKRGGFGSDGLHNGENLTATDPPVNLKRHRLRTFLESANSPKPPPRRERFVIGAFHLASAPRKSTIRARMKSRTKISWADFTINPWEGCTKVSAGCANCYAETRNQRYAAGVNWGKGAPRRKGIHALAEIANLNRRFGPEGDLTLLEEFATLERWIHGKETAPATATLGENTRVVRPQIFSLSLGDVLDPEVDPAWLADFLAAIAAAPHLEFLLLTKRPELFWQRMAEAEAAAKAAGNPAGVAAAIDAGIGNHPNVAWGTSVEDEKNSPRILGLAEIPAAARFISCEPLIGDPQLWKMLTKIDRGAIDLVITGGESGVKARPMHPAWLESIQRDCEEAGTAHHFKQWGTWAPARLVPLDANQANPGNVVQLNIDGTTDTAQAAWPSKMHRTPSKLAVPPLIKGATQQPRLTFPKP